MSAVQYPFIDIAVHPRIRTRLAAGDAIVIFAPDMRSALWANGRGAELFGRESIYDFLDHGASTSNVSFRQAEAAARALRSVGDSRRFVIRVANGMQMTVVPAFCELIQIGRERAILFAAPVGEGAVSVADSAARMIEGFDDEDTHRAVLDRDANVLAASPRFAALTLAPHTARMLVDMVASHGEGPVKRPVPTGLGYLPAAIGRVSDDPPLHLLFIVEAGGSEDAATPQPATNDEAGRQAAIAAGGILEGVADQGNLAEQESGLDDISDLPASAAPAQPHDAGAEIGTPPAPADTAETADLAPREEVDAMSAEPDPIVAQDKLEDTLEDGAQNEAPDSGPDGHDDGKDDMRGDAGPEPDDVRAVSNDAPPRPAAATEHGAAAATKPAFVFAPDMRATRFVWKIDAEGRFTEVSGEFSRVVGPHAADINGLAFSDLAALFNFDPDGRIGELLRKRDTWSGKTIWWPIEGTTLKVPVDLAALPTYTRNREFDGFRGFGIVRAVDAAEDPLAIGLTLVPNAPAAPQAATDEAPAQAGAANGLPQDGDVDHAGSDLEATAPGHDGIEAAGGSTILGDPADGDLALPGETDDRGEPDRMDGDVHSDDAAVDDANIDDAAQQQPAQDEALADRDGPRAEKPALRIIENPARRYSDKVIRFEEHHVPRKDRLTPGEQAAFREIARRLDADASRFGADDGADDGAQATGTTDRPETAATMAGGPADHAFADNHAADNRAHDNHTGDNRAGDNRIGDTPADDGPATGPWGHASEPSQDKTPSDDLSDAGAGDAGQAGDRPDDAGLESDGMEAPHSETAGDPSTDLTVQGPDGAEPDTGEHAASEKSLIDLVPSDHASSDHAVPDDAGSDHPGSNHVGSDRLAVPQTAADAATETDARTETETGPADAAAETGDDAAAGDGMPGERGQAVADNDDGDHAGATVATGDTQPQRPSQPAPDAARFADIIPVRTRLGLSAEIVDQMPVALLVHSGETLIHGNPEFLRLTGYASLDALQELGGLDALLQRDELDSKTADAGGMVVVRADDELVPVSARLQSIRWEQSTALMLALMPVAAAIVPPLPIPPMPVPPLALAPAAEPDEPPMAAAAAAAEVSRLQVEVDELRSILETATDGVVIIGPEGDIRSMNRAASALFNYDNDETAGKPFVMLFAHESQKSVVDYLAGLAGHGVASVLNDGREVIGREAAGGFLPLFMTIGRLTSSNGYCAVIRDITQWKRTEDELRNAKRAAETANAHKSDFLAHVSHEIRTPLNAIIGFADMMASERFGPIGHPRYIEYANDIGRSGRHVLDIVNDLLDISKIEAGEMDLDFVAVGLNDTVAEAVSIIQPQANGQRVIIRTALSQAVPQVVADLRSIKQIVLNILSNAIRFTPSGGQIVVSTAFEPNGSVTLRIRDTGIGMTRSELELAMKPFRQVTGAARKHGDGTGLGLPLTKAMVDANRASFAITSAPNEGTLVEISFPSPRVLAN